MKEPENNNDDSNDVEIDSELYEFMRSWASSTIRLDDATDVAVTQVML